MRFFKLIVITLLFNYLNVYARICENVIVFGSNSHLKSELKGCTKVVGYLKIVHFKENITDVQFPELTAISGFLTIYGVYGLTSIANLFPNLTIIGGDDVISHYALVLHDMPHLLEIGLSNLRYIGRGAIRIDKCPQLCFVNTIDWNNIGQSSHTLHYSNTNLGDCPSCTEECGELCWNQKNCQKRNSLNCGMDCLLCGDSGSCDLCKNFNDNGVCLSECPDNKYGLLPLHTCVTMDECVAIRWFVFNKECMKNCPEGYEKVSKDEGFCKLCGDNCTKVCEGKKIHDIKGADRFRGCTHIQGSLEIYLSAVATTEVLTYGLGSIRVIHGYLRIYESSGITSLNFFKKLKVISGNELYQRRYSLVVFDNKNLRQLWNWSDSKVTLENGIIFFHFNPKLCYSEIENLIKFSGLTNNITNYDVCPLSNGDKTACAVIKNLDVNVAVLNATHVVIMFNTHSDVVGYILFYKEDINEDASINDVEQECLDPNENGWFSNFTVENKAVLTDLNPFTNYAFYVQMCTLTSYFAGRTNIYRFKTKSGKPSPLNNIKIMPAGTNDLELSWTPPNYPGGIITHYEIFQYLLDDGLELSNNENYCHLPYRYKWEDTSSHHSLRECCNSKVWNEQIKYKFQDLNSTEIFNNKNVIKVDNSTTTYTFFALKHYRMYATYLRVCNDLPSCSSSSVVYKRTRPSDTADNINSRINLNNDKNSISIKWAAPTDPNSYIVSYVVQYKNIDNEHSITTTDCVTIHEYIKNQGHVVSNLSAGKYIITVTAISLYGPGKTDKPLFFEIAVSQALNLRMEYFVLSGFIIGIVSLFVFYCYLQKPKSIEISMKHGEQLNRNNLEFSGDDNLPAYGVIRNGLIKSQNRPCTVKFSSKHKTQLEIVEFLKDVNRMKFTKNAHHVISIIGLVFPGDPPLIVMELMSWGDLKSYLLKFQTEISEERILRMAAEIADGMFYLSSQHLTHSDLAARNCMVTSGCTIKIASYGINKDMYSLDYYNYRSKGLIPVRWMAPESIADGVLTINSNVWSYGVVLWEITTGAQQPYEQLLDEEVVRYVIGQRTLERPSKCSDLLYNIMSNCWKWKSANRTNFLSILEQLVSCIRQDFRLVSFYNSDDGVEYRTIFKDKLKLITKDVTVRWKAADEKVSLDTISESVYEDLNLPSTSS